MWDSKKEGSRLEIYWSVIFSKPHTSFSSRHCRFLHYALVNRPATFPTPQWQSSLVFFRVCNHWLSVQTWLLLAQLLGAIILEQTITPCLHPISHRPILHLSIHLLAFLPASVTGKKKADPSSRQLSFLCVNKHNWVCFVYCTKSVWLPRRLHVPSYIFVVCIVLLAPSNTLRAFKISDWKEDYPTSTFVIFVGEKKKKQGNQKTSPSHPF